MQLYIAIEYNDDGTVNDVGYPVNSPKEAWDIVDGILDKNSTKIHPILQTVTFPIEEETNEN